MNGFLINTTPAIEYTGDPQGTVAMDIADFTNDNAQLIPVVFQCSFNGVDAAKVAVDQSFYAHPITFHSAAQLDTDQKKFGTASLKNNETDDHVWCPDHEAWHFGTGNFTIELFARFQDVENAILIAQASSGQESWYIWFISNTDDWRFYGSDDGGTASILCSGVSAEVVIDTWYHVAVSFDGTTYRVWVDGIHLGSGTSTIDFFDSTTNLTIGANGDLGSEHDGWIDEVRIHKGVAIYTGSGNFTPPSAEFPAP